MIARRQLLLTSLAFVAPLGAWCRRGQAQPARVHRVAWLAQFDRAGALEVFEAVRDGLGELGYQEGRNLSIEGRWADFSPDRLERYAAELARFGPAVIITQGGAVRQARRLSPEVPVIFVYSGDPVEAGLISSLARPGGHLTGVTLLALDLVGKRIEILKEILPKARRMAVLANPSHAGDSREFAASKAAAAALGIEVTYHALRSTDEVQPVFATITAARPDAAVVFPDAVTIRHREAIAEFFLKSRIPSAAGWARFADAGQLVSYGPDLRAAYQRLAYFVDKILKGAKPADLPVEQPTKFELVINLKTAKALGVIVPSAVLLRADRVIE